MGIHCNTDHELDPFRIAAKLWPDKYAACYPCYDEGKDLIYSQACPVYRCVSLQSQKLETKTTYHPDLEAVPETRLGIPRAYGQPGFLFECQFIF